MSSPQIETNLFVPQENTPWPTNGQHAPAGGGVVVRVLGNQRPRHRGASSRDPRNRCTAQRGRRRGADRSAAVPAVVHLGRRTAPHRRPAGRLGASARSDVELPDLAYTLARRRAHRPVRTAVIASSQPELTEALREVADGDTPYQAAVGRDDRGPVWVFSGQGSQWAAMGAELLATEPVFAATVARSRAADRPRVRILGDRGDVGARDRDRHRPDPADPVHHAGRAGRHA